MFPGDLLIVRRVITAISGVLFHRIMHALDHSAINGQTAQRGKKALRDAVSRIDPLCVAPFSHDVAMTNDDPIGVTAHLWQSAEHTAKGFDLRGKVRRDRAGLRLGISHRLLKQRGIHAYVFRPLPLPTIAGRWVINEWLLALRVSGKWRDAESGQENPKLELSCHVHVFLLAEARQLRSAGPIHRAFPQGC